MESTSTINNLDIAPKNDISKKENEELDLKDSTISSSSSITNTNSSAFANISVFELYDEDKIIESLKSQSNIERLVDPSDGKSILHLACENNFTYLVNYLLRREVSIDALDYKGQTPLHVCRSDKIVRILCSHGANVSILNNAKELPAHVYCREKLIPCIIVLLSYDFDPSISRTIDLSSLELIDHKSCLHYAAELEDFDILNLFLGSEHKSLSDINVRSDNGDTILHVVAAINSGDLHHQKSIMLLLEKGIFPDIKNNQGVTALHLLCANRSFSMAEMIEPLIELLLNMNCDPNSMDDSGCTPLIIACAHREWAVCKILLQFGADMNLPCRLDSELLLRSQSRSESSHSLISLTERESYANSSHHHHHDPNPFAQIVDCTASDLFPKRARHEMFSAISAPQTWVPDQNRDRCMNCGEMFSKSTSIYSYVFARNAVLNRHHCRHCGRLICDNCISPELVSREKMPQFVREQFPNEKKIKICQVCNFF